MHRGSEPRGRRRSCVVVHDGVAQVEEDLRRQRLSEEVREILVSTHEGHDEMPVLHALANEEMPTLDMLHAAVVLRVVRDGDRRLVVDGKVRRPLVLNAQNPF